MNSLGYLCLFKTSLEVGGCILLEGKLSVGLFVPSIGVKPAETTVVLTGDEV